MSMSAALVAAGCGVAGGGGAGGGGQPPLSLYFNSSEPGGDGSDANVLWADNFERGYWFLSTADPSVANAGWNGTPFGDDDPLGLDFGRAGEGVGGGYCVSQGGHTGGIGQARAMGDHSLATGANSQSEIYFRYYIKPLTGYSFGQEKALTFNKGAAGIGGIFFGTVFHNGGSGSPTCQPNFLEVNADQNRNQNQGNNLTLSGGDDWFYMEFHLKLNGNGSDVLEMWGDNCGEDGLSPPASPTLRMRHTDMQLRPDGDSSSLFGSIWLENWASPASTGEMYYDQIKVSKVGPIGFYTL